jgi:hypothetical protein
MACCNLQSAGNFKSAIGGKIMLAAIAGVLLVLWLLGFLAFHVSSGFIHILLILAVISLVMHLVRGRGVTV